MTGDVIKSFLVGLGFDVDDASLSKFNKAIQSATLRVAALYGSIKIAASAVAFGISKISESFEELGYQYRIITPAINKAIVLRRELFRAYAATGINLQKTVLASLKLNMSLTKTKYILEALYKSVGSRFFATLTKQSDLFREKIYANLPKIQNILEHLVQFIFKALEATFALGERLWSILTRVYDFFVKLDKATDGWSTIILGVIAAWKLLNLEFLATPLGALIAGLTTLLALYDDYQTYQEGGNSLINWKPLLSTIKEINDIAEMLLDTLKEIGEIIGDFVAVLTGSSTTAFDAWTDAAGKLYNVLKNIFILWTKLTPLGFAFKYLTGISGENVSANAASLSGVSAPALSQGARNIQNALQNINANVQTNVNISGVPNAEAVPGHISNSQERATQDLIRNMQGAIKPGGILPANSSPVPRP